MTVDVFPRMLTDVCTLIADYRECYWLRDLSPMEEIKERLRISKRSERSRVAMHSGR